MEAIDLFGGQRGRLAQAAVWAMETGRFSTQALTAALDISTPTAISLLNRLETCGLVRMGGEFSSTGGRKPRAWSACPDARFSVGIDITRRRLTLVAVNLAGRAVRTQTHMLPFARTPAYFAALADAFAALCEGFSAGALLGVGFSIPGIISADQNTVLRSHALSLQGMDVRELGAQVEAPCRMINDANAGCLAEARSDPTLRDAVYLSLSDSVGSALLVDRHLRFGCNLRVGEVGHTTLFPGGRKCYCGKDGCMDAYCRAGLLHMHTGGSLSQFFLRQRAGDAALQSVWEEYLDHTAIAINNLRMMLDCDVIVGGAVGRYIDADLPELQRRAAARNTFEASAGYIKACTYKQEAAALGAAVLWIDDYFRSL